jgi:N-acyl-D-aspartate/D-glutamate deacylase
MAYDLVIRNGRVIDGSGMPSFNGDVAVKDGKIVEMGRLSGPARHTINADGLAVSPGFIDNHCHFDAQVTWDPLCTFSNHHGATTVVIGNCSLALAPVRDGDQYILAQMLSRVEAMPLDLLLQNVKWSWESVAEYMDALDRRLGVNVGVLMGHSAVRRYAMGEASQERAQATGEELEAMKRIVREGMAAGAIGLSFERNLTHFDERGKLLPANMAPKEEIFALAAALGEVGTGVIQTSDAQHLEEREGYCTQLAQISGRTVIAGGITHSWREPDRWKLQLELTEASIKAGYRTYPLVRPLPGNKPFTMKTAQHFDLMPSWQPIMRDSFEERKRAFRDLELRKQLRTEVGGAASGRYGAVGFTGRWDLTFVTKPVLPKNRGLKGKSVTQIAQEQGKDPLDAFLDLALEEGLETRFERNESAGDEQAMATLLTSPYTIVGLSDGGAHLVLEVGYGFSTHFLGYWVRQKQIMSLEEGVRRLTFVPAIAYGLPDRGLLRPGLAADLVVFDPDTVAPQEPEEVQDLPGGASRLRQLAQGIEYTVVNGQVLMERGEHTGTYPGRVARNSFYGSPE